MSRKTGIHKFKVELSTKEDCKIFDRGHVVKTRICPQNGDFVKCNAVCTTCPYALASLSLRNEVKQWQS